MPKFAVALFLQRNNEQILSQRLQQHLITAKNEAEALGAVIRDSKRPNQDYPILYHHVTRIK